MDNGFVHLHLHSQYSLLDGAISPAKLMPYCQSQSMDSVAITDHGNMFGALDFYLKANSAGIKPIIGIEAYISPTSRFDKQGSIKGSSYHLILLAENVTGYHNLMKLSSIGYMEGFYYRPRIDKEILAEFSEGLICSSACISGELARLIASGDKAAAKASAAQYAKIFGDNNFFVEIQRHENDEPDVTAGLIELANEMGLPLLATNDCHYLTLDDYEAHNCLCCISTGKNYDDPARMIYPSDLFVKSPAQMRDLFSDVPSACDNSVSIANRCNVEIDLSGRHTPLYKPDNGDKPESFLTELVYKNAKKIYGEITSQIKARIDRELEVIEGKGFSSYFLIVWDFCNYAKSNNIPVGARGSAVGTIVGYCLGFCNVDPLKYDLLFERFMDPERDEMPDVDIDICQRGRQEIIDYVRQKYGHVAQIITFGTMKARAVIRDVCRVMNIPLSEADRLAKLIPDSLGITLDKAIAAEPNLKDTYNNNPEIRKVIDICKKLEGLTRHASVHAAGVVISESPLSDHVPLYKATGSDDAITQYEGPLVDKVGLLKMDFLGLKTLSVIKRSVQWVKELHDIDIDIEKIDIADSRVFDLFSRGKTKGIFQFESGGMQDLLIKMKPDRLEDLIAANALYRPGPMKLIPDYIDRKHGGKWSCPNDIMTEILEETFGIMIYQEQVMRISNSLGDIALREAYGMIKAISKKKLKIIAKAKKQFIAGCQKKNLTEKQGDEIFSLIEEFAGYGFNKSHSTRYSIIAYQTAFMKTYWPAEFMASLLTYDMANSDKIVDYINECKSMQIEVLAPDINESMVDFTPIYNTASDGQQKQSIRFGLAAIKGVGEKAVEQIISARRDSGNFKSLFHFCETVDLRAVNKQVIDSLIKAGCFDKLGGNRAQMIAAMERAMQGGSALQADKQSGQMNFFGQVSNDDISENDLAKLPKVDPWPERELLLYEKSVLGFYVTSNPLSHCAEQINAYSTISTSDLASCGQDKEITIGGMITKIRPILIKNGRSAGKKMAVFILEDLQGQTEVVLFPKSLEQYGDILELDKIIFVAGKVDKKRETPQITADELIEMADCHDKLAAKVLLRLQERDINEAKTSSIVELCKNHRGKSSLYIEVTTDQAKVLTLAGKQFSVKPDPAFCKSMSEAIGAENFKLTR